MKKSEKIVAGGFLSLILDSTMETKNDKKDFEKSEKQTNSEKANTHDYYLHKSGDRLIHQ